MATHTSFIETVELDNGGELTVQSSNSAKHVTLSVDDKFASLQFRISRSEAYQFAKYILASIDQE